MHTHIIISDEALRGAVSEAVSLAGLVNASESANFAASLKNSEVSAIILDEPAADKKALKAFQDALAEGGKKRIFLLGEADAAWKDNPDVEGIPKPVRLGHLLSRLLFHVRARSKAQSESMVLGPYRFEAQKREIVRQTDGTVIRLTEKETALLDYLAQSTAPVGREELLAAVWGYDGRIDTHTLETHIYQLRRKLGSESELLANEGGAYHLKV